MGLCHGEQSQILKVLIAPALMVAPTPACFVALSSPKDASQPHAHPPINVGEGVAVALFEVIEPSSKNLVDIGNNRGETLSVDAFLYTAARGT